MRPSLWIPALAALAVSAQQQQIPTEVQTFEIDNVFPRNETYKRADVFPIVFALQNMTAMASIGQFELTWSIMPFGEGRRPSGLVPDYDLFMLAGSRLLPPNNTAPSDGTTYLVDYTNFTAWFSYNEGADDRLMLQWSLRWPGLDDDLCDRDASSARAGLPGQGSVMFNVPRAWGKDSLWKGPIHDALVTAECPQLGSVVEIAPNATTPECPAVQKRLEREGNPCGAQPDEAAVSSIMSQVSSMAAPTSTTAEPSSTSSGGVGPARTVQTALAAACLLCGLAL